MSLNIIEFLNKAGIRWMPIKLELKETKTKFKKTLKPYDEDNEMPSYTDMTNIHLVTKRQAWLDKYQYIWIDTRVVAQIDVDGDIDPNIDTPYFKSVSKQKAHYFVRGFHGYGKKRSATKWADVELLCGQGSYAEKTQIIHNENLVIKDYSGDVDAILVKDNVIRSAAKKSQVTLNPNIDACLNELFATQVNWRSNSYESNSRCVVLIPGNERRCLVNPSKVHSAVQSYITLGKTTCCVKCHSCGDKKIDSKKNPLSWKQIRNYFELSVDSENVGYDAIQDYLDEHCAEEDLMKKDGYIMKRSNECCIEYERVEKFDEFLDTLFRDAELPLKRAYKKPAAKRNLVDYLTNIHTDIRTLKRDSNIVSFKNGYLKLQEFTFHQYDDSHQYTFIAKKYIPQDFDPEMLNEDWDDIKCPIFDKIINDQPQISQDPDVILAFYGLLGSLHYPVGGDSIKVVPYLVGTSGTGKSTVVNIFTNTFNSECIGTINYKEKTFGKSAFLDHDVIIDADTPANMIAEFGKTDFQKAVSGEVIAIPIKNQKQEEQHRVTQRMCFCSQYMQDVQDTGEVIRRLAYFDFVPVENTKSDLEETCIKNELHLVLIKTLLARKKLLEKYGNKPFHEWDIPYFDSRKDDILMENNYIYRMISEHSNFRIRKGARFPFEEFVAHFHEHYKGQPSRPKKPKTTDVMFTKMGLSVGKDTICKDCLKPFSLTKACCKSHAPNNKTTRYYINDLYYKENIDFCQVDDDEDIL
tara:strand:- start:5447 stop:7693 length:2247 start_codon:yes stop_codon:yes gene_type:complete